jgi:GNAT superfamily N-acetyltransferase
MEHRFADDDDLDLLAEWNHQLIQDEGHRNPMTVPQLRARMKGWLDGEYQAVVFTRKAEPVAYALFKESAAEVYLRQLFVRRDRRREGIGRKAVTALRNHIWPRRKRLTVEVLTANRAGVAFWHSVGYRDYCLTLEIMPEDTGQRATTAADVAGSAAERQR